jgi:hypothetical protein
MAAGITELQSVNCSYKRQTLQWGFDKISFGTDLEVGLTKEGEFEHGGAELSGHRWLIS